ncbi:MAG: EAL domain-containing protein [Lysobacteraceae bacterium]
MRNVYRQGLRFVALVGLYLAGVEFAMRFIGGSGSVALFWPSSGLALAAIILYGRLWALFIPVAIIITQLWLAPAPWSFVPFSLLGNTLGALAGSWLVGRMPDAPENTMGFGFRTLAGGALFALVAATIGVPGMLLSGMIPQASLPGTFLRWLMGDLLGVVAVTPALLIVVYRRRKSVAKADYGSESESLVWNIALVVSYLLMAWGAAASSTYALGLTALPLAVMIWSALRFEPLRTALSVLVTVTLIGTMAGLGLSGFQPPARTLDAMILLSYLCLLAILPTILSLAVQERRIATAALLRRANCDPLTGLPNRTAFEVQVKEALQDPSMPQMALGYLDLDNLKLINDTASHTAGDAVIAGIAHVLSSRLEPGDLLAHLGADEFILLFRHCSPVMARERAASLLRAVEGFRCDFNGQQFSATASLGVAPFLADNADFSDLLSQADAACFTAKELGGNRVCIAGAQGGDVLDHTAAMHWAVRIREALEEHQFALFAQAIQPLRQTEVGGRHFEILLRMRNPRGGLPLTPDRFMPAAERFRLGVRIDREVVGMVLDWLESHPHAVEEIATCAINLSAGAMVDEGFIGFIAERLRSGRVAPRRLCFEITETSAVRDVKRAQRFIDEMRGLGCRFALDDFGTGFCSFSYLSTLDVDYFKIDGSFVRDMETSPLAAEVVRSITSIAHVLKKRTIAEHTESIRLRDALITMGVDYAQGYAIEHPIAIDRYFAQPLAELASAQLPPGQDATRIVMPAA